VRALNRIGTLIAAQFIKYGSSREATNTSMFSLFTVSYPSSVDLGRWLKIKRCAILSV